jgi:LacI family transcriptional regulator
VATIKDVAREAGVSIATVSRVFNDNRLVSAGTRRQVRKVATRLNYWPNGVARSLITSRTNTLGLLLPELHGEFFSSVIRGIDLAGRRAGLHLLVSSSHADMRELIGALRAMRGRIDGLVVMAPDLDTPAAIRVSAGSIPIVLLDPGRGVRGYDTISIANFEGAYAVVRHLAGLGHRRIATVTGPGRNVDARERLRGYRAALRDGDLAPGSEIRGGFTEPSGYAAVGEVLRLRPRPTAVFVGNDYMAVGVMRALHDAGIAVPEDVAVAGFDDIEMSRFLDPPLTTVRVDTVHLGERAVSLLIRAGAATAAGENDRHHHEVLPTSVVVRRSCGSQAGAAAGESPQGMESRAARRRRAQQGRI